MNTQVIYNGRKASVNPLEAPKTFNQLNAFLRANNGNSCFVKIHNVIMKVTRGGEFKQVTRALYLMSLEEFLLISLNDNY